MIRNFIFIESITIVFLILMLLSLAEAGGGGLAEGFFEFGGSARRRFGGFYIT